MPLVSVVIAAYRNPNHLNQALDSVASQTFGDFEIVVADDCSGEETVSDYHLPKGAKLVCHSERFGAAAATRNSGIREASGKYVALLDQDDIWLPDKLERQVDALERAKRKAVCYCHALSVDEKLVPIAKQGRIRRSVRDPLRKMIGGCFIPTPSVFMAPLEGIRSCGMFDESVKGASDWDFYLRIARDHAFIPIPERLALYRMHQGQLSRNLPLMDAAKLRVMDNVLEWARLERPAMVGWVRSRYGRVLYKMAVQQMRSGEAHQALQTLADARRMWLWSPRVHWLSVLASRARRTEME